MCEFWKKLTQDVQVTDSSWQGRIDKKLEHDRNEAERLKQEAERIERERVLQKQKKEEEVLERKKLELGNKFQCYKCGTPSRKPLIRIETHITSDYGAPTGSYDTKVTDWNFPGDLKECTICHEWACEEHIYKGICQTCAEKL